MFVDKVKIKIKAGNGGDGAVAFHREKYISSGGPDGGDGGRGGDVVFVADTNLSTLVDFKFKKKFEAQNGVPGTGANCSGKNAPPLVIRVPMGTLVKEAQTDRILADVSIPEPFLVAKGGKGGWGDQHFATPTRQTPRFAKPGLLGESYDVVLELKLLADVGLLGYPNVGKSTLISVCSDAKPKIANYHFTTLTPILGVVRVAEDKSFVMADIPGIIEGASEGLGLGHEFLRHVERCRLNVHIVDVSGFEGRDPKEDFEKINAELAGFNRELSEKPQIVVANKSDIATSEQVEDFKNYIHQKGLEVYTISAATRKGVDELIYAISQKLDSLPPIKYYDAQPKPMPEVIADKRSFTISVEDGVYVVDAEWLAPILNMVDMEDYESLQYFQRTLISSGIIDELVKMGIQEGDVVSILDLQFNYIS